MSLIRAFIAIPLSREIRPAVAQTLTRLRRHAPGIPWAAPENIHLTLAFLGDVAERDLSRLTELCDKVAGGHAAYAMSFSNAGYFPDAARPRVVWVGVDQGVTTTRAVQRSLAEACRQAGFPLEARPFIPHLTLARMKHANAIKGFDPDVHLGALQQTAMQVDRIALLRSQLSAQGARYTVMHESFLHAAA